MSWVSITIDLINVIAHRKTSSQMSLREWVEIFLLRFCVEDPIVCFTSLDLGSDSKMHFQNSPLIYKRP